MSSVLETHLKSKQFEQNNVCASSHFSSMHGYVVRKGIYYSAQVYASILIYLISVLGINPDSLTYF